MSVSYILPLKAPPPLPATGVDIVSFKVWKNTLVAHIQQDANHFHFLPGGLYATWTAAEYGARILVLDNDDPEKVTLDGKRDQVGAAAHRVAVAQLLRTRNAQLSKFITHVATLCHHTENDDVTNCSTSLEWIFTYLKKHYGLETKGANFMNIADHTFKKGTPYQTFYKQYRASFIDNLRKTGDRIKYKNDLQLTEDEKLTPSFENAIVLWTLDKIDARLPSKVKKDYGHQMTGDYTLKDIQPVIFENINNMLEDLEQAEMTKAFAAQTLEDENPEFNSITYKEKKKTSSVRSRARGRGRIFSSRRGFGNNRQGIRSNSASDNKFCRLCNFVGSDAYVYTSHEIGNCTRLSMRDMESLRNALLLNGMITMDDIHSEEPPCVFQPGWDDVEASNQDLADSE